MNYRGDLLYYDANTYDEFILDYVDGTNGICQINKKVGYNADGTTYALATPQVITYTPYPLIHLTTGDYTITLPRIQSRLFVCKVDGIKYLYIRVRNKSRDELCYFANSIKY